MTANGETYRPTVLTGVVTASDLFGVSDEKIADMRAKLDPDIMEMESAAIAQVCAQFGTPHIVFRAGSNRTQPNPARITANSARPPPTPPRVGPCISSAASPPNRRAQRRPRAAA